MPSAEAGSGSPADPHGFGAPFERLGTSARRSSRGACVIAGALLGEGETVEALVAGRVYAHDGAVVLTTHRLLLLNDREFKPEMVEIPLDSNLSVEGWQDDRMASLTFSSGGFTITVDSIRDRDIAQGMARAVRMRTS